MRRVVVTGLGCVTPLGANVASSWERLIQGACGIVSVKHFETADLPSKVAGLVPTQHMTNADNEHHLNECFSEYLYVTPQQRRTMDQFIVYAIAAAQQAIDDSGLKIDPDSEDSWRSGVIIGSGIGGLPQIEHCAKVLHDEGIRRLTPFFIPSCLINLASGQVSIRFGLKGPNHSVVTACASGAHAIGDAMRLIQYGDADVMIAGGSEAAVCRLGMAGFSAARALSTSYNDTPQQASRPWDKGRDGFVMGEGAGIVVLEELKHALARGAKIYGEIIGYGLSGDAHHITAPSSDGDGAYRAMKSALGWAKINPQEVDYINAHGTSTPLGDAIEVKAMKRLFNDHAYKMAVSSTKSAIGHLLGAAGSVEFIFSVLSVCNDVAPPTLNLFEPSEGCDLNFVPHSAQWRKIDCAMSNSFGFGGTNVSLVVRKFSHS
jgi:3-oxoacyl-[acyl-carrier-protein] synthase II